jgi:hypothetical protein
LSISSRTISFSEGLLICPAQMANTPGVLEAFGVFGDNEDIIGMSTVASSLNIRTHKAGKSLIFGGTLEVPVTIDQWTMSEDEKKVSSPDWSG